MEKIFPAEHEQTDGFHETVRIGGGEKEVRPPAG